MTTTLSSTDLLLFCMIVLLGCLSAWLWYRISLLTRGADGKTLEHTIRSLVSQGENNTTHIQRMHEQLVALEKRTRLSIRNVQTNRFDPFEGASGSGRQSFAVALLDDDGNGAVISSLHAHDRVRVFAKPISKFTSTHELSDEEKKVIAEAR